MNKVVITILEDDMIVAAEMSMQLTRMGYEISGIMAKGEDALAHLAMNKSDLILVDIHLKGTLDGVEMVEKLRAFNRETGVIYITANVDDASYNRAKTTKPEAFIAKPFKRLDLARAIELAILRMSESSSNAKPQEEIMAKPGFILDDRIFVKYRDQMVKVFLHDIFFAEADRNYCNVFTADKDYLMMLPLKAFESKLNSDRFIRIHRSYIVNLTKVDSLSDHCEFVNIGKRSLPVSRSYRPELMQRLKLI